jgi:ribosomal protein S18 acetylase RimI-like enzyme
MGKMKSNKMIASLSQTSMEEIHEAFIDAFSDYEVRMDMPLAKLQEMMVTRSCSLADSLGYFGNGKLLGFLLVGKRIMDGKIVLYDVATGVVKGHQGEGIGDALVQGIVEAARTINADRFILEVLQNNEAAQKLYAKYGFGIARKLKCYECSCDRKDENQKADNQKADNQKADSQRADSQRADTQNDQAIADHETRLPADLDIAGYCTFNPSWQNSCASFMNMRANHHLHLQKNGDVLAGYGIVHTRTGSILQLGMHPDHRSTELLETIVTELCRNTGSTMLRYLNVEEHSLIESHLINLGFRNAINQFEMAYVVNPECRSLNAR